MTSTTTASRSSVPWYREPWPWLLMAGPATVLVAGAFTMWIAFSTSDGLVAQDYYKQGMAVNKVLAKEEAAARLGLSAVIELAGDRRERTILRRRVTLVGGVTQIDLDSHSRAEGTRGSVSR